MKRLLNSLPIALVALLPVSAVAASPSPTPAASAAPNLSPTLDHVLIAAPAGFVPWNGADIHGHFTAHDLAQTYGVKSSEAERLVAQNGFVDGYGLYWLNQGAGQILTEFVIAFTGGRGAQSWLAYDKATDEGSSVYEHADTVTGIEPYFGVHMKQSSVAGQAYLDGFTFVKGNDEIGVGVISVRNDGLNLASSQTKGQYAAAPGSTIPSSQWPENADKGSTAAQPAAGSSFNLARVLGMALVIAAAVVAIVVAAALLVLRSRRTASPAAAVTPAAPVPVPVPVPVPAFAGAGVAAAPAPVPGAAALQMSPDGNYWFDGRQWISSAAVAPPFAPRSPDGGHWWDGFNWRPVPQQAQPTSGR